jgi:hypothetical protein
MKRKLISEVKQLQKIAGILSENKGAQWMSKLNPEVNGIEIYNDGNNRLFVIFDKNTGGIHVINDFNGEDFDEVWGTDGDVRSDLLSSLNKGQDGYDDTEDKWANVPNTVEGWVDYLYKKANPKQKAKLANIYRKQMENEEAEDARDFFIDLIDSSDPDAIIDLKDLNQY